MLPRKTVELIGLIVNAACTNLSADATRRHIRGALEAGATREEIPMVLKMASLVSIHTYSPAAPILLEEAKAAGVRATPMEVGPRRTGGCRIRSFRQTGKIGSRLRRTVGVRFASSERGPRTR
jgi:hypothetical protein